MSLISFNRGRNDCRDRLDNKCPPIMDYAKYHAGYEYQEGIINGNKYSEAFEDGKNTAKKGHAKESNPHPANSNVWSSWNNGWEVWHITK